MDTAGKLLKAYESMSWDTYIKLADGLVEINKDNLETELLRQSSNYAYLNGLASLAKKDLDVASSKLDQYIAITRKSESMKRVGEKTTDKMLESLVTSQPEYQQLVEELTNRTYKYNLIRNLVQAIECKKDMLVQLSANTRAEINLSNKG